MSIEPRTGRRLRGWVLACALSIAGLVQAAPPEPLVLAGIPYEHRWSKDGQNEYTPPGQEDLERWEDMLTLVVRPQVADGEALAGLANGVLAQYQGAGVVLRTDSRPATPAQPAEHLVVAILGGGPMAEAAFARLVLHDGAGLVVVRSRRAYGDAAALDIGEWLQHNGAAVERSLMQWSPPPMAALRTLPQAPQAASNGIGRRPWLLLTYFPRRATAPLLRGTAPHGARAPRALRVAGDPPSRLVAADVLLAAGDRPIAAGHCPARGASAARAARGRGSAVTPGCC